VYVWCVDTRERGCRRKQACGTGGADGVGASPSEGGGERADCYCRQGCRRALEHAGNEEAANTALARSMVRVPGVQRTCDLNRDRLFRHGGGEGWISQSPLNQAPRGGGWSLVAQSFMGGRTLVGGDRGEGASWCCKSPCRRCEFQVGMSRGEGSDADDDADDDAAELDAANSHEYVPPDSRTWRAGE